MPNQIPTAATERYLLDSNIFDKLADDEATLSVATQLIEAGKVTFVSTHVQADELSRTPDEERLRRLLNVPVEQVPTFGFVIGYSRLGMARLSDEEPLESLRGGNLDHTADALIGATAHFEKATLVTEDRGLRNRAVAQGVAAIDWEHLRARLHELVPT